MKILKLLIVAVFFSFGVFMVQPTIAAETLNYSHGTYVGDTLNGKAHGFGTYTSKQSGTKYTGQFVADTFSGNGTMIWTSGAKFVGQWQNDSGVSGSITYPNGATAAGTVRNAVFQVASQQTQGAATQQIRPLQQTPPSKVNTNFICLKEYLLITLNGVVQIAKPTERPGWQAFTQKNLIKIQAIDEKNFSITEYTKTGGTPNLHRYVGEVAKLTGPDNLNLINQIKLVHNNDGHISQYYIPKNFANSSSFAFYFVTLAKRDAGIVTIDMKGTCRLE